MLADTGVAIWQSVTFLVPGDAVEAVSDALLDGGAASVEAADGNMYPGREIPIYGEPGSTPQLWATTRLTALFPRDADGASVARIALACAGMEATAGIEQAWLDDTDWVRHTQQQFQPIRISQRLWVVPTWHEPRDPSAVNVVLDPGVTFGTGTHPTTRLCLEWLGDHVAPGDRVLDYGCGSGILAIAAMKLGAGTATGVDIDPQAVLAAARNGERNRVAARFVAPDALPPGDFDIVIANILTNPLRALAPLLAARVRGSGGKLVLSGILERQVADVMASYAPTIPLTVHATDDGWALLTGFRS